jgi:hypothetical protein
VACLSTIGEDRPTVWALAIVALCACGRIGFDPSSSRVDAASDTSLVDADPLESGLLLHFAFEADGFLYDRAPGHHAAECVTCPTSSPGRVGTTAASFTGTECVEILDASDLHPPVFTFALWLDVTGSQRATVFGRAQNGATDTTDTIEMFFVPPTDWYVSAASQFATGPVNTGSWHHVVGAFDGNTIFMFVDGSLVDAAVINTAFVYTNDSYRIGCDLNVGNQEEFLIGMVDDIRLYDRVLTASEIAMLAAM